MNAEKYNPAEAYRLIESAHPKSPDVPRAAELEIRRNFAEHAAMHWMDKADRYQRRCRILTVVSLALALAIVWMVIR